jgi:hypothetical protein
MLDVCIGDYISIPLDTPKRVVAIRRYDETDCNPDIILENGSVVSLDDLTIDDILLESEVVL